MKDFKMFLKKIALKNIFIHSILRWGLFTSSNIPQIFPSPFSFNQTSIYNSNKILKNWNLEYKDEFFKRGISPENHSIPVAKKIEENFATTIHETLTSVKNLPIPLEGMPVELKRWMLDYIP